MRRLRLLLRGQRGLTLIETVLAIGLLGMIAVAFMSALAAGSRGTRQLDEGVQAEALVRSHLEAIKECAYAVSYPDQTPCAGGVTITIPSQFTVGIDTDCTTDPSAPTPWGLCPVAPGTGTLQRIKVSASREGGSALSLTTYRKN